MIKDPTVLILGAGASVPYGFPSGAQLRDMICVSARGPGKLQSVLQSHAGIPQEETTDFARQFHRSQIASIDAFLAKRSEFTSIGKRCIAAILTEFESPDQLEGVDPTEHWYGHLWNVMIDGVGKPDDLGTNAIKFISFNYDRSLEHFLHTATKYTFGVDDAAAERAWKRLPILHVYGSLGQYHYLPGNGVRQYHPGLTQESLSIAAGGIEVIPEARDDSASFAAAKEWCSEAQRIGFLGFGFDRLNVARLALAPITGMRRHERNGSVTIGSPMIVASAFGKTPVEVDGYKALICPSTGWTTFSGNCLMTLRSAGILG